MNYKDLICTDIYKQHIDKNIDNNICNIKVHDTCD